MTAEPVTIRLLGEVRVTGIAPQVVPGGRRAAVVLARLAVDAGQPVTTEELAATVWPGERPAAWRASLRNVIAELRSWAHGYDVAAIVAVSGGYRLDLTEGTRLDGALLLAATAQAETLLARDRTGEVLDFVDTALTDGDFLDGEDAPWIAETRDRLTAAKASLLLTAATAALRLGQTTRAEALAVRAIELDEIREDGHRLLIRALSAAGNRGAALEAYHRCRAVLVERLGTEPSAATRALFEALLADDEPSHEPPRPPLLLQATAALVGRRDELHRIDMLLERTRREGPLVLRIEGEAGIGKTRLAAEVAARTHERGVPVLYGRADDRLDAPHHPLLEAIDTHLALLPASKRRELLGPHASHLADVLPALRGVVAARPPSGLLELDRRHRAAAIGELLAAIARSDGAVLILDDMQWAGRPTAELLDRLGDVAHGAALLVLALYRSGADGAARAEHVLTLGGLPLDDVEALARTILGASSRDVARTVWDDTGGNPLFATEILRAGGTGTGGRSERLRQLVRRRTAALPRSTRNWLDAAAVAGLEFEPEVVRTASGLTEPAAAEALAATEADGLVTAAAHGEGRRAFRHALVRQCLLDDIDDDPAYVMSIHQRLGRALEQQRDASVPRLAHHATAAAPLGDWRRAVRYGLAAARTAAQALVHDDVVAICVRSLGVLDRADGDDVDARLQLTVLLGTAQRRRYDPAGETTLVAAFERALAAARPQLAAEAALGLTSAGAAGDELAVDTRWVELYERALTALGDESDHLRAQLLGRLSTAYSWLRDGDTGRRYAEEALRLARATGDVAAISTVLISARRGLSGTARPDRERAIEDELLGLATTLDDPGMATGAWLWRFESAVEQGRGDELEPALSRAATGAAELGVPSYRYTAAYSEAARLLLRGEVEAADAAVDKAYALGTELGVEAMVAGGIRLIQLMGVRHEQGRLAELRDELADHFGRSGVPEWEGTVAFADAELGRLDTVDGYLEKVFAGYESGGVRTGAGIAFAAHMANPVARLGDVERAQLLYDLLAPYRGLGAYMSYFVGPVDHALGLLARTVGSEADAQRHFGAGSEFSRRLGASRWVTRCDALRRA